MLRFFLKIHIKEKKKTCNDLLYTVLSQFEKKEKKDTIGRERSVDYVTLLQSMMFSFLPKQRANFGITPCVRACHGYVMSCYVTRGQISQLENTQRCHSIRTKKRSRNKPVKAAGKSKHGREERNNILWLTACYVTHISYSVCNDIEISN